MEEGNGFPRQSADWLGMTPLARCAGRCTPRVLVPLRSTAWASPPTDEQRGVRSCDVSPSVTAKGRDTSLAEGGEGSSAPAGAGDGFPRQSADWLGMTPPHGGCMGHWRNGNIDGLV